ncbi:MAG TPA: phosphatase PAP2 family protein [Thermoleophilaceae bacterium]|nr:phosphatase PAP2 family protein [Thermoleophilaceae bacterium]
MIRGFDRAVLRVLRTRGHGLRAELAVAAYSSAGEHGVIWHSLAAAGFVVDGSRRPVYLRAVRAVLLAYAANTLLKFAVRRARPVLEELPALAPTISGHSYPSAHSAMSFAAARVLSEALPAPPLYAAAAAMALSRPYLGVHYPSDVLAGAGLGDAVARLTP